MVPSPRHARCERARTYDRSVRVECEVACMRRPSAFLCVLLAPISSVLLLYLAKSD